MTEVAAQHRSTPSAEPSLTTISSRSSIGLIEDALDRVAQEVGLVVDRQHDADQPGDARATHGPPGPSPCRDPPGGSHPRDRPDRAGYQRAWRETVEDGNPQRPGALSRLSDHPRDERCHPPPRPSGETDRPGGRRDRPGSRSTTGFAKGIWEESSLTPQMVPNASCIVRIPFLNPQTRQPPRPRGPACKRVHGPSIAVNADASGRRSPSSKKPPDRGLSRITIDRIRFDSSSRNRRARSSAHPAAPRLHALNARSVLTARPYPYKVHRVLRIRLSPIMDDLRCRLSFTPSQDSRWQAAPRPRCTPPHAR